MRLLLPLVLVLPLAAETHESFTLADGRRLVGTYDAERQHLRLAGPVPAAIRVTPQSIVERRPATPDEIPAANTAPVDPAQARTARLRTAIRGLDQSIAERANHRIIIERRMAVARADHAEATTRIQAAETDLAALAQDRQRLQGMLDEVEQAVALTELRIVSVRAGTSTVVDPGQTILPQPTTTRTFTVEELTTELTSARRRIADLRTQLATCDATIAARRGVKADALDDAERLARAIAEDEARLARYAKVDAEATAERGRLTEALEHTDGDALP